MSEATQEMFRKIDAGMTPQDAGWSPEDTEAMFEYTRIMRALATGRGSFVAWMKPDPEICPGCEGDGYSSETCLRCNGSGEGMADGTRCRACNGTGTEVVPCEDCNGVGTEVL